MKQNGKSTEAVKIILIVIGALVSLAAIAVVAYTIFKKYFQVTFECDGDCDTCDDCFADMDDNEELECSYAEEEKEEAPAAE